jgi:hypothetical protein
LALEQLERYEKQFEAPAAPSRNNQQPKSQQPRVKKTAKVLRD